MLTKAKVMKMISCEDNIFYYIQEMKSVYLGPMPQEEIELLLDLAQKTIGSYENIIQQILKELDETIEPTDHSS